MPIYRGNMIKTAMTPQFEGSLPMLREQFAEAEESLWESLKPENSDMEGAMDALDDLSSAMADIQAYVAMEDPSLHDDAPPVHKDAVDLEDPEETQFSIGV